LLNTLDLLQRLTAGEQGAVDALVDRSLAVFGLWARRRIPSWAVGRIDVIAVVRAAVLDAVPRLRTVETSSAGALQAVLRDAVRDRLEQELLALAAEVPHAARESQLTASVLEQSAGRENLARYERALAALATPDREAIIGRLELGQSYEELATAMGQADAAAARLRVTNAVARLVEEMVSIRPFRTSTPARRAGKRYCG
jgi:DNA-directed RNA polymerase specialized sigma24 family protein